MKKIIPQKLPVENGHCVFNVEQQNNLHKYLYNAVKDLDEPYIVVTTPTEVNCINDDSVILQMNAKRYTYKEIKSAIDSFKSKNKKEEI